MQQNKSLIQIITFECLPCAKVVGDFSQGRREGVVNCLHLPLKKQKRAKWPIASSDRVIMKDKKKCFFLFSSFLINRFQQQSTDKNVTAIREVIGEKYREAEESLGGAHLKNPTGGCCVKASAARFPSSFPLHNRPTELATRLIQTCDISAEVTQHRLPRRSRWTFFFPSYSRNSEEGEDSTSL